MYAFRSAHEARDAKKSLDLRDESGERIIASRRASPRAAITESMVRREVARDLEMLMNAIAMGSTLDLDGYDHVERSIVNFGFPDISHRTIDESSVMDIKDEIRTVLTNYEPRLRPDSIQVVRDTDIDEAELRVRFLVNADLFCDPVDVPVEFIAEVELDSGKVRISRL